VGLKGYLVQARAVLLSANALMRRKEEDQKQKRPWWEHTAWVQEGLWWVLPPLLGLTGAGASHRLPGDPDRLSSFSLVHPDRGNGCGTLNASASC
jgi:hypothetical protein